MVYTIKNAELTVSIDEIGAQLMSVRSKDGTEYLWQGDAGYWKDRALNLFPFIGRLPEGKYSMDGRQYSMPIHGFAPTSRFEGRIVSESAVEMILRSSKSTFVQYPRELTFSIRYELEKNRLNVTFTVVNKDSKCMYFGIGGHPGINVPLAKGRKFEEYRLRFGKECKPVRIGFSKSVLLNGETSAFPLINDRDLLLKHSLFDNDAIVLKDMAHEVSLECERDTHKVIVRFPQMKYLGIWHWPYKDAPYVCIEPWTSLPAEDGKETVFEEKQDLICLSGGETYINRWQIEIQ